MKTALAAAAICILVATAFVILGTAIGYTLGYDDAYERYRGKEKSP